MWVDLRELAKRLRGDQSGLRAGLVGTSFVVVGYVAEQPFAARESMLLFPGRHPVLDKPVIVKILRPEVVAIAAEERRMVEDARGVARLQHHNLASLVEFGRDDASDAWC